MKTHFSIFFLLSVTFLLSQQPIKAPDTPRDTSRSSSSRSSSRSKSPKATRSSPRKAPSAYALHQQLTSFQKHLRTPIRTPESVHEDDSGYHGDNSYDSESPRPSRYYEHSSYDDTYRYEGDEYSYREQAASDRSLETDATSENITKKAKKAAAKKRRRSYAIAGATAGGLALAGLTAGIVATNMTQDNKNNALASNLAATNATLAAGDATLTTGLAALNTTLGTSKLTDAEKQSSIIELLRQRALQSAVKTELDQKADKSVIGTDAAGTANDTGIFAELNTKAAASDLSALTTTVGTNPDGTASDTGIFAALNTKATAADLSALTTTVGTKANAADLATLRTNTGFAADGTTRLATGLAGDLSRLTTTIGDASAGLVRNVNSIQASDSAQAAALLGLSGEIRNQTRELGATYALASTTAEAVNNAQTGLASRASAADLAGKANTADVYTKDEIGGYNNITGNGTGKFADVAQRLTVHQMQFNDLSQVTRGTYSIQDGQGVFSGGLAGQVRNLENTVNNTDTGLASRASAADLAGKANTADVYSRTDANNKFATQTALADKANVADVYTRTSADAAFASRSDLSGLQQRVGNFDIESGTGSGLMGNVYNKERGLGALAYRTTALRNEFNTDHTTLGTRASAADLTALSGTVSGHTTQLGNHTVQLSPLIGNVRSLQNVVDQHSTALTDASSRFATREFVGEGIDASDGRFVGTIAGRLNTYKNDMDATHTAVSDLQNQVGRAGDENTNPTGLWRAVGQKADASNVYSRGESDNRFSTRDFTGQDQADVDRIPYATQPEERLYGRTNEIITLFRQAISPASQ